MAFSQRDLYEVRREIEKDGKQKCAIIYGGLPPGEETLFCICFKEALPGFERLKMFAQIFQIRGLPSVLFFSIVNIFLHPCFVSATKMEQAYKFNDPSDKCSVLVASDAIGMGLNL